jgi:SOS-response transcriptional repressor LexA
MITTIVTFLTTRVVAVFITTFIVFAAVPTLIIAIHGHTITVTQASPASQHGDDERTRIILHIKTAGDVVIVKLNSEEASCDSQITALTKLSKISVASTQAAIKKGKTQFQAAAAPFVRQIRSDEDEISHLTVVSTETERTFLLRITSVSVTALGENGSTGVLITVCQTIIVEIRQIIITVVVKPGAGDDEGD